LIAAEDQLAGGRVEGGEEFVGSEDVRAGEGVEQRGFTGVGVADDGAGWDGYALAFGALHTALQHDAPQLGLEVRDAITHCAAIVLELRFTFAAQAALATLPRKMGPRARQAREGILHSGEGNLEGGLAGVSAIGENFQNDFLAIDHGEAGEILPVALLRGREGLIENDDVGAIGLGLFDEFLGLAGAEKEGGGGAAKIDEFGTCDGEAEIFNELGELKEEFGALAILHIVRLDAHEKGAFEFGGAFVFEEIGHVRGRSVGVGKVEVKWGGAGFTRRLRGLRKIESDCGGVRMGFGGAAANALFWVADVSLALARPVVLSVGHPELRLVRSGFFPTVLLQPTVLMIYPRRSLVPRRLLPWLLCLIFSPAGWTVSAAVAEARPNILFIIFDDWGWQHAGAYGSTWVKTPHFDRVAREGVLFKNAFTSNPKCSPCRATILTGRNSWQLKEAVSHNGLFPEGFEVYPDLLERAGYTVGLTGKGWGPGDFKTQAKRTRNPAGPSFDGQVNAPVASGINRNDYGKNFDAFLQQREAGKPFCFWMGFHEPHRVYEPNSGVRLGKTLPDVTVPSYLPDTAIVRGDLADYAIEVEWADAFIGKALASLEARGELENTLVIVTSDHGMPFPYVKGQIHADGFRLPLAMRWGKAIKPGRVVEDFINVRDFAPTYLEIAGLAPHPQITGRSLATLLRSPQSGWIENRSEMLVGKERHDLGRPNDQGYPVRALQTKDFLYVHNFHPDRWPVGNPETDFGNCDPSPTKELLKTLGGHFYDLSFGKRQSDELYDLRRDPEGVINLAHDLAYAGTLQTMRARMMTLLVEEKDPRALGNGAIFDTYRYTSGRQKSYDTWLKAQEEKIAGTAPAAPGPAENAKKGGKKKQATAKEN